MLASKLWEKKCCFFLSFCCFFFPPECEGFFSRTQNGSSHVRHLKGVSKEPFSGGWMGTGDTRCSHPVTICTGVTLLTQIGHRCSSGTQASIAAFWTRDEMNAILCENTSASVTAISTGSFVGFYFAQ